MKFVRKGHKVGRIRKDGMEERGGCLWAGIFGTESAAKECDGNRKGKMMEERRKNTMILYRNLRYQQLFDDMCSLLKPEEGGARPDAYACASQLIDLAVTYGFRGNLWHCFLAFCMANNENAYSTSCEIIGPVGGSLSELARHDFAQVRELFSLDIARLDEAENGIWSEMKHYENALENSKAFNHRIRDRIVELSISLENAESDQEFQDIVTEFYKEFGVGKFGLNKAFRIDDTPQGSFTFRAINNMDTVMLDDLVGYEIQKKKLVDNTEAFVQGKVANNCLLYGDAGTGKSTSIKAILNQYYGDGLRMIEIYKHQFKYLSAIISHIKNRNYRFIIYMDDLSFEEFEIEYKYLKAVIEGGMETKPDNVLIYATSNRRHLIRETWSDRSDKDEELHRSDTVQEKLSLAARFGVSINYSKPTQQEYFQIVTNLAKKYPEIKLSDKELCAEANKWELSHGGISGRTAQQFINYIAGKSEK